MRLAVLEAVISKAEKEAHKARKALASQIANQILSNIKMK